MGDRGRILARVRSAVSREVAHPGDHPRPGGDASWSAFADRLVRVGGEPLGPVRPAQLGRAAGALLDGASSTQKSVAGPGALAWLGHGPWALVSPEASSTELAAVDFGFFRGDTAIAENGAVGLSAGEGAPRAAPILCETLVLLVAVESVVADLHAAFDALPERAASDPHYTWISGPSKTADIERTLVLGAHGPRRLVVVGVR